MCCTEWARAHEDETDNEHYGPLVSYHEWEVSNGPPMMGHGFVIKFCPFCGAPKE